MKILGIETSCDETGAAIVLDGRKIISNVLATSLPLHAETSGIIPEKAAREQIKYITPIVKEALQTSLHTLEEIDAIAVTFGPGLIGSLLVGVETAKTLAYIFDKSIVPVNHLIGHIYANWLENKEEITFPAVALIISGGHTDLVLLKDHGNLTWLGGTRDDAAGEALDKIGRLLDLSYPGGPEIEKMAREGNAHAFNFPRPLISSDDFDFSFSGLKTAVLRLVLSSKIKALSRKLKGDIAASTQKAIIDVLIRKTIRAAQRYKAKSILLSGGVAANQTLRDEFQLNAKRYQLDAKMFVPEKSLCTDNGAMIAAAAFFNNRPISWQKITANPQLHF